MDKRRETSGLRSLSVSDSIDRQRIVWRTGSKSEIIRKEFKSGYHSAGKQLLLKGENSQKAKIC